MCCNLNKQLCQNGPVHFVCFYFCFLDIPLKQTRRFINSSKFWLLDDICFLCPVHVSGLDESITLPAKNAVEIVIAPSFAATTAKHHFSFHDFWENVHCLLESQHVRVNILHITKENSYKTMRP